MNRITQDPSKVGKAMRTIALRLTGTEASKAELEEDGEEVEGMVTNVSKLRDIIMQATKVSSNGFKGFDILKDNGAYKSTYEILLGIAEVYDEIVENDEKTGAKGANLLLETIAGKNRASVAASILQSPDMLKKAYAEAIDAEGSAEIENAKYIDSISGHLEKLKNAWQELWANAATREFVNNIIDFGTKILEAVNNLGLLKSAFVALAGLEIFKFFFFNNDKGLIGGLVNSILQASSKGVTSSIATNVSSTATEVLSDALAEAGEESGESFLSVFISKITAGGLGKALANGTAEATANAKQLGKAFEVSLASLKGMGFYLGGILGAILAITAALKAVDILNLNPSETAKEAEKLSSNYQDSLERIQEHKESIKELSATYKELSQGVNTSTNTNLNLTNEEYSKYLDTCNKIAELYPTLVTGYDLQGNAIVNLTGNVKELREALIEEQKTASETFLNGGLTEDSSIFDWFAHLGDKNSVKDNFKNNYKEYEDVQQLRNQFLNQDVTLDDYYAYRTDLLGKSLDGDIDATNLLNTLDEISNGIINSDEQLSIFLKDLSKLNMPKEMQQSMKEGQQTLLSKLSLNDSYWDLIYNDNEDISKSASSIFTNVVNGLSPEQLKEVLKDEDSLNNYINNLVNGIDNLFNKTSQNTFNWSEILDNNGLKKATDEYTKSMNQLKQLGYSLNDISSMVDSGKVGNVNLNTDRVIQWNEDNLNKYISQLRGWNEGLSDEDIINQFKDKTSTVLGSADTFNFGEGTIDLSFSIISEDGRLYGIDELYNYINDVLKKAEKSGEPLTIDTIYKYDTQHMIAGEGFNASDAMHEIELLKGFGDTKGWTEVLGEYKTKYGDFVDEILSSSGEIQNQIKNIGSFQDILNDLNDFSIGEGILANANMGDFAKISNLYKQAFVEAFADSEIDGAQLFETMFDDKGVSELRQKFINVLNNSFASLDSNSRNQAIEFFNSLGQEEAELYIESFNGATNFADVDRKFSNFQRSLAAKTHETIINIEDETAAINTLKSAISSSNGDVGLSSEEISNIEALFKDLMDEDGNPLYSAPELFENTANGIRLNQKQLKKLNNEYKREKIEEATDKLDYYQRALQQTQDEIDKLRGVQGKEADLSAEEQTRDSILQNIDALQREIAQYEGLTSAYNEYVSALSTTNGNAGYDTIQSGYDTVKDLIDRGWAGSDEVRQYVQMFSKDDVSTWTVDQLIERFNALDVAINDAGYSYKDFFTVDEDGKTTSDGVFNFLDALKQEAKDNGYSNAIIDQLVSVEKKYSKATDTMEDFYSFDFDAIGGDQAVADLMNMDISTLHKWLEAAEAAGFNVVWTDYAHSVQKATSNIEEARKALEEFKEVNAEKYELNTSAGTIEEVNAELSKAQELISTIQNDGTLSPEANTASLNYVQAQLDKLIQTKLILEQPMLFNTNIADVDTKYQDLFIALQNYGYELQKVQSYGQAGLPIDTSQADQKLRGLLKALQGLDKETQKEFGIDFDLEDDNAFEKLKEKLANEEITIPINQVMGDTFDYSKLPQGKDTIVKVKTVFDDNGAIAGLQLVDSLGNVIDDSYYTANVDAQDNATEKIDNAQEELNDFKGDKGVAELEFDVQDKEINSANRARANFERGASTKWTINSNIQTFSRSFNDVKNEFVKPRNSYWTIHQTTVKETKSAGSVGTRPSRAFGTAHALGTAYARGTSGNWGVPDDQDALVGELGEELVVFLCHYIQ